MSDSPASTAPAHLLTTAEAAAYLNVPKRWLGDAVRAHQVRCVRLGKHVRFRLEHLEELIAAGEQPVLTPAANNVTSIVHRSTARARL